MDRSLYTATLALFLALWTICAATPLSWENIPPISSSVLRSRWFAGSVFYNGQGNDYLYVFGGEGSPAGVNDTGILGDTLRFDFTNSEWTVVNSPATPSPRYGFISGLVDGNFWVISHGCDQSQCFSDTWALNLNTNEWLLLINTSSVTFPYPEARFTTAGGVFPGENVLWLSMGETSNGRKLSDTWILRVNFATEGTDIAFNATWEMVNAGEGLNQYHPLQPHARSLHAGTPVNGDTFTLFGGCASGGQVGGPCPLRDSWTINLRDRRWVDFPQCPSPRTRHAMVALGPSSSGTALLLGGSQTWGPGVFPQPLSAEEYNSSEVYIMTFNPNTTLNQTQWKRVIILSDVIPDLLEGVSLAVDTSGGVVYLFGGRLLGTLEYRQSIWRLSGNLAEDPNQPCPSPQFTYVHLHGIFMYVAWGLFLPLGALLGRYYKWAWPCWFILHVICQSLGVLFTVAGFVVIFLIGSYSEPNFAHAIIGIVLTALLIQQYLSGIFHPCVDKENGKTHKDDKTIFRRCWEVYHAVSGLISIAIGIGQVTLGVFLVVAPVEVWALWCGLGGLWVLVFLAHECGFLCYKICHRKRDIE